MININIDVPSWTDIIQAISALIAVPLTLFTLYKLVKKDKEREAEIRSLSTIASQLTRMQLESGKRYRSSKKPFITINCETNLERKFLKLNIKNSNTNTTITSYDVSNDLRGLVDYTSAHSSINDINGTQEFWITLSYKNEPFEFVVFHIDYITEEEFVFIQDIILWFQDGEYVLSPTTIIDKQNSPTD